MNVWECICTVIGIIVIGLCICLALMLFVKTPEEMEDELPKEAAKERRLKIKEEAIRRKALREEANKNKKVTKVLEKIEKK